MTVFFSQCDKAFSKFKVLKIHKKIHSGDYPFGCSTSTFTFSHFGVLKSHSIIHIERKNFHFHKCENIVTLKEDFPRHMNEANTSE